ncbi:hypothetical protein PC9H_011551 [Pleurotus ostreatus]|uniref:HotDog ACOT-type domain-containing protein n=1 Tax=Pleurotus ostreatus TaxID=5322 RepID=A0A8H7DMW2_PLEOS|nr:uncharacterized protein PC9H_011551 [Pleurotus ostreatus]KAF7421031.1 hypothetical protein PC9H_011551 [Pleurotus ostreatus]
MVYKTRLTSYARRISYNVERGMFSGSLKRPTIPARCICTSRSSRSDATKAAPAAEDVNAALNSPSVAQETEDVTLMDKLLTTVRRSSNPAFHSIMPLRKPGLWAETLLSDASSSSSTPEPSQKSPESPPTPRNMTDSYSELILPFGSSPDLLEQYTNAAGGIRTGKLMEHLDSLAGSIAYKHMLGPDVETLGKIHERGFYIVTASVDRLDMLSALDPSRNLRLSGQVIYTGRSSMEVVVKMESIPVDGAGEETVLIGRFSMVCRDAYTHSARDVNPLITSTAAEKQLFALGDKIKHRRQSQALRSLSRVPPSSEEAQVLHEFWLKFGKEETWKKSVAVDGKERVWMGETMVEKTMLMFPQERNVHSKVFGGYLMRLAYELGFTNASLFTRGHVRFLSLDKIAFARPVPIGSILKLTSCVLHSTSTPQFPVLVHIGVKADVIDPKTGQEQTTNDFRFTWCRDHGPPLEKVVVPRTYRGSMLWLEGRRALQIGNAIRDLRTHATNPANSSKDS